MTELIQSSFHTSQYKAEILRALIIYGRFKTGDKGFGMESVALGSATD
ncbi:hypothetical protein NKI20_22760 [Mesorhizobium sp. M0830]